MFRIREKGAALWRKLGWETPAKQAALADRQTRAAIVAKAIYAREQNGVPTTLRLLHQVTPLTQPQALKAVAELEKAKMVVLQRELNDVLASSIVLTDEIRRQLSSADEKSAV